MKRRASNKRPRIKQTFRIDADISRDLVDAARRLRVSQASIVESALASHLSPDGADQLEGALSRRLDRMSRQLDVIDRHIGIDNETLVLFVRFWLTAVPPLPDSAQPAAQAQGRKRFENFVETLGRRLAKNRSFADELIRDLPAFDTDSRPGDKT